MGIKNIDRLRTHGRYISGHRRRLLGRRESVFRRIFEVKFPAATEGSAARLLPVGSFAINAPTSLDPFAGASAVWPNAPGINILDNSLQNPMTQQFGLELERLITRDLSVRAATVWTMATGTPKSLQRNQHSGLVEQQRVCQRDGSRQRECEWSRVPQIIELRSSAYHGGQALHGRRAA
jgi:hypothetical protein